MDLVRDDGDAVFEADVSQSFQFFPGPEPSGRILRVAKEEQFGLLATLFKIFEIETVFSVFVCQLALADFPAAVFQAMEEGIVSLRLPGQLPAGRNRLCHCGQAGRPLSRQGRPPLLLRLQEYGRYLRCPDTGSSPFRRVRKPGGLRRHHRSGRHRCQVQLQLYAQRHRSLHIL